MQSDGEPAEQVLAVPDVGDRHRQRPESDEERADVEGPAWDVG